MTGEWRNRLTALAAERRVAEASRADEAWSARKAGWGADCKALGEWLVGVGILPSADILELALERTADFPAVTLGDYRLSFEKRTMRNSGEVGAYNFIVFDKWTGIRLAECLFHLSDTGEGHALAFAKMLEAADTVRGAQDRRLSQGAAPAASTLKGALQELLRRVERSSAMPPAVLNTWVMYHLDQLRVWIQEELPTEQGLWERLTKSADGGGMPHEE